jgi:hypothetical protein
MTKGIYPPRKHAHQLTIGRFCPQKSNPSSRTVNSIPTSATAKISVDPRQKGDASQIDRALSQVQVTKTDVSKLPGIREALNLTQLEAAMRSMNIDLLVKQRPVESIIESYQQLTGRSWREMTYPEKDALEKLRAWARK